MSENIKIYLILLLFMLSVSSCQKTLSNEAREFKKCINSLNDLLIQYENIPNKEKKQQNVTFTWKDKKELDRYISINKNDFQEIENCFHKLSNLTNFKEWKVDIIFCQALMFNLFVGINPKDTNLIRKTIGALSDFVENAQNSRLHEITKKGMKTSIFNRYKKLFDGNLSDEINLSIIFQMHIALHMMRLNQYQQAIRIYNNIIEKYPSSVLADTARVQIKTCKDAIAENLPKAIK